MEITNMNANEKIYIKAYNIYVVEDNFTNGETDNYIFTADNNDQPIRAQFNTIDDALKAVCDEFNLSFKVHDWEYDEYTGNFIFSILVDKNVNEVSSDDIEAWEQGKKKLFSCNVTVTLGVCNIRNLLADEIKSWENQ